MFRLSSMQMTSGGRRASSDRIYGHATLSFDRLPNVLIARLLLQHRSPERPAPRWRL